MTSVEFLIDIYNKLNNQERRLTFTPMYNGNWWLSCNNNAFGALYDNQLYLQNNQFLGSLLGNPELIKVYVDKKAHHLMYVIPVGREVESLDAIYQNAYDGNDFVYDITDTSPGAAILEEFYDKNVVFLKFCFEHKLLKKYPLDKKDRIIRMTYHKKHLTEKGKKLFKSLLFNFLEFYDRNGKTSLDIMLHKWLKKLEV